jgi:single-strand DNA-binding protein
MNDTYLTLVGNVVADPKHRKTNTGTDLASFRVASTSRRFDRESGTWVDNETLFVTVTCWRGLALNVMESVRKGQPVIVTGRYYSRTYVKDEITRVTYELAAEAVGHDLARGTSIFSKTFRGNPSMSVEVDADGIPADLSGERDDIVEELDSELAELTPLSVSGALVGASA